MSRSATTPQPGAGSTAPQDVAARLGVAVARLHRTLRRHAESGLSPSQLSALVAITRHGAMTLGELAAHEGVAPPTITGVVGRLEADGNVVRQPDDTDRRLVRVLPTDQGRAIVAEARGRKDAWLARALAELGPDEVEQLAAVLPTLEALAEGDR